MESEMGDLDESVLDQTRADTNTPLDIINNRRRQASLLGQQVKELQEALKYIKYDLRNFIYSTSSAIDTCLSETGVEITDTYKYLRAGIMYFETYYPEIPKFQRILLTLNEISKMLKSHILCECFQAYLKLPTNSPLSQEEIEDISSYILFQLRQES